MYLSVIPTHRVGWNLTEGLHNFVLTNSLGKQRVQCNQTAVLVWRLIDGKRSLQEIIGMLKEAYPDVESIQEDVEIIVDTFVRRRVVKYSKPS
jgi:hypothetical protein